MAESWSIDRTLYGDWLGILFKLAFILFWCTFMEFQQNLLYHSPKKVTDQQTSKFILVMNWRDMIIV